MLGIGIANYVNIFEPAQLAIGAGALARVRPLLRHARPGGGSARALPALWKRSKVALAEGASAHAGVIGAGLLAALEWPRGARY
jgi:predicted NBD/HSP70 family sugar kinase